MGVLCPGELVATFIHIRTIFMLASGQNVLSVGWGLVLVLKFISFECYSCTVSSSARESEVR